MPNITDPKYRGNYQLYNGKPCLDENASLCRNCLERRVGSIGETIGYDQWGDSPHFTRNRLVNLLF
jgi:biotin synthase